jgi:acyl carrier protein
MQSGRSSGHRLATFDISLTRRRFTKQSGLAIARAASAGPDCKDWSENIETMTDQIAKIRSILKEHGRLSRDPETLAAEADLYQAGMTSHASVNVMLALEGEFDVEFPDHMLKRNVFNTIASIGAALDELAA